MPIVYRCSKCGKVLYVFEFVGQDYFGIPSPSELHAKLGGLCPYCGKPLSNKVDPRKITVR